MTQVICWWLPNIYVELRASAKNFKFPCSFAYSASLTGYLLGISDVVYPKYNFWFLVPKFIWPTVFIISVPSNIQIFKPKTWELDWIPLFPSFSTPNASASPVGSIFVICPLIFTSFSLANMLMLGQVTINSCLDWSSCFYSPPLSLIL